MKQRRTYLLFLNLFLVLNIFAFENPKQQLSFKENKGQVSDQFYKPRPDVLFYGSDGQINFHLRNNGISYQLSRVDSWRKEDRRKLPGVKHEENVPEQLTVYRLDINWLNSNKSSVIRKEKALEGYDNYYLEVCPTGVTNVRSYEQITYESIYKGVDLKWYTKNGNLKYDYIVSPGADHKQIQFEIKGAEKIYINDKGQLIIKTPLGEIIEEAPYVTQKGKVLSAKWRVEKSIISFNIKNVDPSQTLIIDPLVRLWGTYYGGTASDELWYPACNTANDLYVTGFANSLNNIATAGAYQTVFGGMGGSFTTGDALLVKFNSAGVRQWATYYGGSGSENSQLLAIDPSGDVCIVGTTSTANSAVMSTPGTEQTFYAGGGGDAYLARFSSAGMRIWSTYIGGPSDEWGIGLSTDGAGNFYVAGGTGTQSSSLIATPGAYQTVSGGGPRDAFLIKYNSVGIRIWGTYYGGGFLDQAIGCTADAFGNVYLVGETASPASISTPGTHQPAYGGGGDGFIAKFDGTGNRLWGTYYGGPGTDYAYNVVIDNSGNIFLAGTASAGNPSAIASIGAHQPVYGGGTRDCFLAKFSSAGNRLWGSYYGGTGTDQWGFCTVNSAGEIFLSGETTTSSGTAIATPCTYQDVNGGGWDGFLAKFTPLGERVWGTFYGGSGNEIYASNTTDLLGNIYVSGPTTTSSGTVMADPTSHQPFYAGATDGYIAKFDGCKSAVMPNTTSAQDMTVCVGENTQLTTTMSVCGLRWYDDSLAINVIGSNTLFPTPNLTVNTTFYIGDISCGIPDTLTPVEVTVTALPSMSTIVSSTALCAGGLSTLTAQGATSYTWLPVQVIGSVLTVTASSTTIYSVTGFDGNCYNSTTVTVESVPFATLNINSQANPACYGSTVSLTAAGAQTYSWFPPNLFSNSTGSLVNTLPLQSSSTYTIVGYNTSGAVTCSTQNTYSLNVVPQIIPSISPSVEICEGSKVTLTAGGGNTYSWLGENIEDPVQPIVVVAPSASGIYQANVSVNNVCPVTATVFVKINPKPTVFAGNDTIINIGDPVFVSATGSGILKWIAGENIGCVDCPATHVLPTTKSCYLVEVTDAKGCKAQDEVCIEIQKDYAVYIPNTFTPNNDGVNDIFYVFGFGIKDYKMTIYNRWGIKLFTSTDQAQGWDGKYNGEICEQGTYIYYVEYTPHQGKHEVRPGHVNIIRGKP